MRTDPINDSQKTQAIESKIDQFLTQLSVEEKVAMCHAQSKFSIPGVVRVYIGKPKSKVERVLKGLKGFQKIHLKPGATARGSVSIDVNHLSCYDESRADWHLEKGDYLIYIGNSSDNITDKIRIKIN